METLALDKAKDLVKQLVSYRDEYISLHGIENASKKNEDVEHKVKETLIELDRLQLSIDNKAMFFYLRGQTLNVLSAYDQHAEECLSKAVKLDPNLIEAWNELGESYWKNRNIEAAANCFTGAIAKKKNKVSLRNLSMVQRQLGTDYNSKVSNVRASVDTAKEAVSLDVTDGRSWFVLGNAYLSLFFFAGQNPGSLKQCMAAYKRAESDSIEKNNPDLHYNRAVAHKYEENFNEALQGYRQASLLDPSWDEPEEDRSDLIKRLKSSQKMIQEKGSLKPKKINQLKNQFKDSDYGPYASGIYVSPSKQTINLKRAYIVDLRINRNDNLVICGKVVGIIIVKDSVPCPFILMDSRGTCIAVSAYNVAVGKGVIVGDSVTIPEPFVQEINVSVGDEVISYLSIRVDNPVVMVINKHKVGAERLAFSVLSVTNKSE